MKKSMLLWTAAALSGGLFAAEVESGNLTPGISALVKNDQASGGAAVRLIAPAGVKLPVADVAALPGPSVTITETVDKPGMYSLKVRAYTRNDGTDSVFFKVDNGPVYPVWYGAADHKKWSERTSSQQFELASGKHTIAFYIRESGIELDKAEFVFRSGIRANVVKLTGKSPYKFTVRAASEYRVQMLTRSPSKDLNLYGTLQFDGGPVLRRVMFPAWGRGEYSNRLMHITLQPGEHTLAVTMPENTEMKHLLLVPVDRKVSVPEKMAKYQPPFSPVKGEHPRLLMRKQDIPRIRANFASPENAQVWAAVQRWAKQSPKLPVKHGVVVHSYSYLQILHCKAFVYAVTDDEAAGRDAAQRISEYLAKVDFDNLLDVTRLIGHTIYVTSCIYDWCYPLLSDAQKTVLRNAMLRLGLDQEIGWPPLRQTVINGHGNESQLSRDFLAMSIAIYDEDPEPWKVCSYRILEEMVPAHNYEYRAGRHTQGTNYGPCRFRWDLHALLTLERLTGKRVFNKSIETVPFFWVNMMLPNQELFDDTDIWVTKGSPFRYPDPAFNMYVVTGDPLLKAEFLRQGGMGWAMSDAIFYLLFNRPEVTPSADYARLPLTWQSYDPLPSLVARSSWVFGKASPSAVVEMRGATYNRHDHTHMNAGAFQVYFRAPLLVDIGCYGHWGGHYDFHFAKRTIPHNCMLFYDPEEKFSVPGNDGGQRFVRVMPWSIQQVIDHPEIHRTGKTLAVSIGPDRQFPLYSHLKSDLAPAYSSHKLKEYTRSFVYLNTNDPAKPAVLLVYDRTATTKPEYTKYFLLNSPVQPKISGNTFTFRNHVPQGPDGVAVVTSLLPKAQKVESKGNGKAMEFFKEKVEMPPKNRPLSMGWRTMISPAEPAIADDFLNVIEVGTPEAVRSTAAMESTGNRLYVTAANWLVSFAKELDSTAAFTVKKPSNVLLTDLQPGVYTVRKDGKAWISFEVKKDSHTLFFPAEPGRYSAAPGKDAPMADYSKLKATVPDTASTILLNGKKLDIVPQKAGLNTYYPAVEAAKALGGTAEGKADEITLNLAGTSYTVKAGEEFAQSGKLRIPLGSKTVMLQGKLCVEENAFAALAGYAVQSDGLKTVLTPLPFDIIGVKVSSPGDGSPFAPIAPANEADYWGVMGGHHHYTLFFRNTKELSDMQIAWFRGHTRRAKFTVSVSDDGTHFKQIFKGESSGKSDQLEKVSFAPVKCRALRLDLYGNTNDDWNSIRRIQF